MNNKIEAIYGWFSEEQAKIGGWSVYSTPDGRTIHCSMVSPSPTKHDTYWTDMVGLGAVVEFLEHYDAKGKLTSQSAAGRKMYGDRIANPPVVNTHKSARAVEVIEFMAYPRLTTFSVGKS